MGLGGPPPPQSLSDLGLADASGNLKSQYIPRAGTAPEKVTGFVERWKASSLSGSLAAGAKVPAITGVNGLSLAQATSGNQPTFVPGGINGKPAVLFTGASGSPQSMTCPAAQADQSSYAVFAVIQLTGRGTSMDLFGLGGATNGNTLTVTTNKPTYYNAAASAVGPKVGLRGPGAMVLSMVVDQPNNLIRIGLNGVEYTAAITGITSALAGFGLAQRVVGVASFPGQFLISDATLISGNPGASVVQAVARYLLAEYQLDASIPATRPRAIVDGNSILADGHASKKAAGWSQVVRQKVPALANFDFLNLAIGGATMGDIYTSRGPGTGGGGMATVTSEFSALAPYNIVIYGEGTNGQDAATTGLYAGAVVTAGGSPILLTTPARVASQPAIDTLNGTLMSSWETYGCVQVAAIHQDYRIGLPGALQNANLNGTDDNLHPGDSGNAAMAEHAASAIARFLRVPGAPIPMLGTSRGATTITAGKFYALATNERTTIRFNGSARRVGFSSTVTTGATSATQTVGSTAGWAVGDTIYFGTSKISAVIATGGIVNSTTVTFTTSITTATGEFAGGYSNAVSEAATFHNYWWDFKNVAGTPNLVASGTNTSSADGLASAAVTCVANGSGSLAGYLLQFAGEAGKDIHFVGDVIIDAAA
jgi:hypothetical protein